MNRSITLLCSLSLSVTALAAETPELEWLKSPRTALRKAAPAKAQILMLLGSKNCGWCRRLEQVTFLDPEVKKALKDRVLVSVDVDAQPQVGRGLNVMSVPDIRLFTSDGMALARAVGYQSPADFLEWVKKAAKESPSLTSPSLKSLRPAPALDAFFKLEDMDKQPGKKDWVKLLALAAGPSGETRAESLRLVARWAPLLRKELVEALRHPRLKVRLAAYEALWDLGAPLKGIDPYGGPLKSPPGALVSWLESAVKDTKAALHAVTEADLALIEEGPPEGRVAARERLISRGVGIIEQLRGHSRSVVVTSPAAAARIDEIRFRILLPRELLRRSPDASERLSGSTKDRSLALEEILAPQTPDLGPLVREALCDPDPLFRKTAVTHTRKVLGEEAQEELRKLLEDADLNVRKAARKELRKLSRSS